MKKPTIEQIINAQKKLGFKIFLSPYDCNLGAIRSNDKDANTFNDFAWIWTMDHNGKLLYEIVPATVDAGMYYRINPMKKNGTAIIQHNVQHMRAYQFQFPGLEKLKPVSQRDRSIIGHKGQTAFRQINDMKYWRDNNKNVSLDFEGETFIENAQTNGHYMGTLGRNVDKWSAGCWGSTVKNMDTLYDFAKVQKEKIGSDIFSFSLIHEDVL